MTRQITVRLDDSQAESLARLMHGGRSANEVFRTALTHYDSICRDASGLRAIGAPGGLIQIQVEIGEAGFTFAPLRPLVGRKEAL